MTDETTEKKPRATRTAAAKSTAPAIYPAIHRVMEGMAAIPKNGVMKFGNTNYTYLKADDVQERLNPLLVENGIVVKADYTVETLNRGRNEQASSPYVYVYLILSYISVEDGSELQVSGVGEAQAADDKSINKALTQAIKNVHRATFQFASGEPEPDDFKPRDEGQAAAGNSKIEAARGAGPSTAAQQGATEALKSAISAAAKAKGMESEALNALGGEISGGDPNWFNNPEVLNKMLLRIQG